MENSMRGSVPMQEKPNFRKSQGAKTPSEQNPGEAHWSAVKTILKYLRNTKDMVLVYRGNSETVTFYIDVGFQTNKDNTNLNRDMFYLMVEQWTRRVLRKALLLCLLHKPSTLLV
ncbi:hypothetical protein Tco_0170325 [Tanacetum coccineum]